MFVINMKIGEENVSTTVDGYTIGVSDDHFYTEIVHSDTVVEEEYHVKQGEWGGINVFQAGRLVYTAIIDRRGEV